MGRFIGGGIIFRNYQHFWGHCMGNKRILVAYASRYGSTGEISQEIGEVLRSSGMSVDVRNVCEVTDLSGYQGAVIGSPIYMGKWLPEAAEFVRQFQEDLRDMPVAVFAVGFSMKEPTESNRQYALTAVHTIRPYVHPFDIGLFGGKITYGSLSTADRDMIRMSGAEEGDFRDWDEITAWASGLIALFESED